MQKFFSMIILVFLLVGYSFGQVTDKATGNTILGGFSWKTLEPIHLWSHLKDVLTSINPKEEFIAIVVCSPDPLPVAISLTSHDVMRSVFEITPSDIEGYPRENGEIYVIGKGLSTIPRDRILLLRRITGCESAKDRAVSSTYWQIHRNNELPPFVEVRSAVGIENYEIVNDDNFFNENIAWKIPKDDGTYQNSIKLTPQIYKTALEKTVLFMKEHRTAFATIKVSFSAKRLSQISYNRAIEAQKFLKSKGINSSRVYLRYISGNSTTKKGLDDNKYPNISIVYEYKQKVNNK